MLNICCIITSSCSSKVLPYLKQCLHSLKIAKIKNIDLYICLVSDNPLAREKLLNEEINNFLLIDKNLGFAQKHNLAIDELLRFFSPDYFLLINDDVWIEKDFFKNLYLLIKKTQFDLLNPLVYLNSSDEIDSFGSEYFTSGHAKNAFNTHIKTTLLTAACLLIKTSLLTKMKNRFGFYFNEKLYYYLEDVEFSIRALAIGATLSKNQNLKVHHYGSLTAGKKSFFVLYYTYRNVIWIILMTWPTKIFWKNIHNIILVQKWVFLYSLWQMGLWLYTKIIFDTLFNIKQILILRKKIISGYNQNFNFESVFSEFAFRTHHDQTFKL